VVPSAAGAIVLVRFPFSDLSQSKLRPAIVLADAGRGDWVLCQITSNPYSDTQAIMLSDESFRQGGLQRTSYARPAKLFTANHELMVAEVGVLTVEALRQVINAVVEVLHSGLKA
jgi:mRNA interferase MazF